jgi:hypothetical protein
MYHSPEEKQPRGSKGFYVGKILAIQKKGDGQHDREYSYDDERGERGALAGETRRIVTVTGRIEHTHADNFAGRTARAPGG